ncbi:MAG: glutamyl-tRNA reductase, partial [Gemmatimonadetes bacterium]|nr:glutamyl-tRNA reductase [Gemmatimonadota bacterium]
PQIQGQVGTAYREGESAALGPILHRLFQSALAAGGRVRATTSIARGTTSIPSAAVSLARKVFGSLADRSVLVLGTGEMGRLTVRCLRGEGVRRVYVASRNPARAERVARTVDGIAHERADALRRLQDVDLVVTCTDADAAFLTRGHAGGYRAGAPLVLLDIALPRNVDPAVSELPGVFLYNVDDLQRVVDQAREARAVERERAEAIVERHAARFWDWVKSRAAAPAIRELRSAAHEIVADALASRPAAPRDADEEERIRVASRAALNKILHAPTQAVRRVAERSDGDACLKDLEALLRARGSARPRGIADGGLG